MASFTTRAKDEILSDKSVRQHYKNQQSFGIMVFSREFSAEKMEMLTSEPRAARYYSRLVQSVTPLTGTVTLSVERPAGGTLYRVTVDDVADRRELHNHFAMLYPEGVTFDLLGGDRGVAAFLGGVFLACGTLSDPTAKFHLEFALPRKELTESLTGILGEIGFQPLISHRRGQTLVYFNESSQIEDMLTLMGCPQLSMEFMTTKIIKERRNAANRASNCDNANIERQSRASEEQIAAINLVGIDSMPDELRELAELRLENPYDSLRELGSKMEPPLSRSGVNHRLERILQLAERVKKDL